jgi:L-asparaginase II
MPPKANQCPVRVAASALEPIVVELRRGGILESRHLATFVEVDADGSVRASRGDPELVTTLRSSAKPLQALPLFPGPGDDLTDEELAICCASHTGGERRAALVARVLERSGFPPEKLVCGPAGDPPSTLQHGCSGNHAAMVLGAQAMGAPLDGYHLAEHPVQRRILSILREVSRAEGVALAGDGCGVPTFGLRLREMARAFAGLCAAGAAWRRIPEVMGKHADLMGGAEWIDVRLMQVTHGRVIAKTGAVGLLCLGLTHQGRGMAVKVHDGSTLALGPATLAALRISGWITENEIQDALLAHLRRPTFGDALGTEVARMGTVIP